MAYRSDGATRLDELWGGFCSSYHFDDRIRWRYASDILYDVRGGAVVDVDNTLTLERTLTSNWLARLYGYPEVYSKKPRIDAALKRLQLNPWEATPVFDEIFLGVLKRVLLTRRMHDDACAYAADNTAPAPGTRDMLFGLRGRGIEIGIKTYGMEDALDEWYERKVGVKLRPQRRGTRLIFRDGLLHDYDMGGPYGKVSSAQDFVRDMGLSMDEVFAIDDDPVIDRALVAALGIEFVVWLEKDERRIEQSMRGAYSYPGSTPVVVRGAEKDMRIILEYVDKWRRKNYVRAAVGPSQVLECRRAFGDAKSQLAAYKSQPPGRRDAELMHGFIRSVERVLDAGYNFISIERQGADKAFSDVRIGFRFGADEGKVVLDAEHVCELLEGYNPELQLDGSQVARLEALRAVSPRPSRTSV